MKPADATQYTRALLTALEIEPTDAGKKLVELPMDALVSVIRKMSSMAWAPVADGARSIRPMVARGTRSLGKHSDDDWEHRDGNDDVDRHERSCDVRARRCWATQASRRLHVARGYGAVIQTFKASRPSATPSDLFFAITTAIPFRRGAWQQADQRAAQNAAPVYLYELDWHTPVDGGKWQSPHSLELALVFDNVAKSESMVGKGQDAQKVADQMSAAWLAFARTGNPNTGAIPELAILQAARARYDGVQRAIKGREWPPRR